ncbi:MAG TPA: hypothetical protein VFA81_02185 [Burkholderiales bacterium]|nr:hypothetical protein [Burkholderiales bacterium]
MAQNVILPPSPRSLPLCAIPHPPFHGSDAFLLILIFAIFVAAALSIQARRKK